MKCPLKFNNQCCDVTDECDPECAWSVALEGIEGMPSDGRRVCSIAVLARNALRTNEAFVISSMQPNGEEE